MHACTEQITYWTRQVVVKYLYRIVVLVMVVVVCRQGNRVWGGWVVAQKAPPTNGRRLVPRRSTRTNG